MLTSGDKTEQVPLPASLDKDGLKRNLEAALKRFTPGALRTVALYTPPSTPPMPQLGMRGSGGATFQALEAKLRENAVVEAADLKDGRVPEQADVLFVAAPEKLDKTQVFAIDQFLMKGGTVIIATSPYKTSLASGLRATKMPSGLKDWLAHHGLNIQDAMVLDPQNTPFPVPVERNVGGYNVRQIQLINYPYFIDVRSDGLAGGQAPTAGLSQITLSWAAPVSIDAGKAKDRKVTRLVESSRGAWVSTSDNIVPDFNKDPRLGFAADGKKGRQLLGTMMEGKFTSFFAGKPSPLAKDAPPPAQRDKKDEGAAKGGASAQKDAKKAKDEKPSITGVIERSPESARIIVVGSNSFLSDEVLGLASSVGGTQYLAPLGFAQNLVDWSLEDRGLLALRSRGGQFSRTLMPMDAGMQMLWEYLNYALALIGLAVVYLIRRHMQLSASRKYLAMLSTQGA